ncbi:hypothetical protein JCM8115_000688 [Rhodotorula mucilaginosa]
MSSTFLRLDLTEAQRDAISAHTPYRFHTIPVPPPPPAAAAEANHDHLVVEPYLPLPLTTSPPLILTPQRPTDVSRIVETLTDPAVGMQLIGPPWPFKAEDAHSWGESLRAQAKEVFRDLKARTEQLGEISTNGYGEERGTERPAGDETKTKKRRWPIPAPKIHSLRRADNGAWAGDFGVTRWQFDNVVDAEEKQRLIDENEAKEVLDPTVIWTYGFYLHPELHGKGLMSQVLESMLSTYFDDYLGANEVRGAAYASNPASLKTQERCGFVRFGAFMEDVSEGRGGGQKEVITLRRVNPRLQ